MDPLLGTVIDGRYRIEAQLGEGGLGRVYLARHTRMSRQYAIKVLLGEHAADPRMRQRFAREAELTGRLSHRNVIGVVDNGVTADGVPYLAMDLADGVTLSKLIDEGALPRERARAITAQIAAGLAHAHGRGIVHRDLKPDNIIVEPGDVVRIIDFGIATSDGGGRAAQRLTIAGTAIGTPTYMAPEQAYGEAVDGRADLFALGLILYELLAGHAPFPGTPLEVMHFNITTTPPRLPQVDAVLEALAFWLLELQVADRPADAATVVETLDWIVRQPDRARGRLARWLRDEPMHRRRVRMPALR